MKIKILSILSSSSNLNNQVFISYKITVIIVSILLLLCATIVYYQRRKFKMNLRMKNHRLQKTQEELRATRTIISKQNELIESLKTPKTIPIHDDLDLKTCVILTEEDWDHFQVLFESKNPGKINQLVEKYPNLSSADLRYILLAYLNFSHKEMASSLGISADSLRVTWYRLRKKIHLSSTTTVHEFIKNLNNPKNEFKKSAQIKMVTGL